MNQQQNQEYQKSWLIFLFIVGGCIMSCGALYALRTEAGKLDSSLVFLILGGAFCFPALFLLFFHPSRKATSQASFANQIIAYATAEGAALANMVFYFIGGDFLHVIFAGLMIVSMLARYPRKPGDDGVDLRSGGSLEPGKE